MKALLTTLAVLAAGCGKAPEGRVPEAPGPAPVAKAADESRRFPKEHLVGTETIDERLLSKPFLPAGTVARYREGKVEYELFVTRTASAQDAALALLDWKKTMQAAELVPSFGGYFGEDSGAPVFVFAKGPWIAGVRGLPREKADAKARVLAGRL